MDLWIAVMGDESSGRSILGAYSTEELAEAIAERASPGDWDTIHTTVDEIPDWIDELEYEQQREANEESERLRNQHNSDDPQPATHNTPGRPSNTKGTLVPPLVP